jgi:hypothetical protein
MIERDGIPEMVISSSTPIHVTCGYCKEKVTVNPIRVSGTKVEWMTSVQFPCLTNPSRYEFDVLTSGYCPFFEHVKTESEHKHLCMHKDSQTKRCGFKIGQEKHCIILAPNGILERNIR